MLEALRRGAQSWVAKILFGLLIVSFGVFWNVSDFISGLGRESLATVGSTTITVDRFQRAFQNRLAALSGNSQQRITAEMALKLGLDRQVLDSLVSQTALLNQAGDLGLALSKQALAEQLKREPDFRGPDGKFSRIAFDSYLRQIGLSEQGFLTLYGEDELRRQIADALEAATVVPKPFLEQRHSYAAETRTLSHFTMDRAKLPAIAEPDQAKLEATYGAHKQEYMTEETRRVAVIVLAIDDLAKEAVLTDEEVKATYEETRDRYDRPERRRVQQIAFKDRASAEEARKAIVEGKKNFMDVAKETGAKESDTNLGLLTRKQLIDPKIADAAFQLARDAVSEIIDGKFATVLLRVIEIEEGKTSTFAEVEKDVRAALSRKKARALLQERTDLIEEDRNAGKTLKEIADGRKLRHFEVETTARNQTADGKTAIDYPDAQIVLSAAFAAEQGMDHEPVELPSESYAWFNVLAVTPSRQEELDAVKDKVRQAYVEAETAKQLTSAALGYIERLMKGEDMGKIATEAGGTLEVREMLRRNMVPPGLTDEAMRQAFSMPKGAASSAPTPDARSLAIFRLDHVNPAIAPTQDEEQKLGKELGAEMRLGSLATYLGALRNSFGVTVNDKLLQRVTGADAQ
jgi:peptidyl-prolyl cis-trans isomerase D